MLVVNDISTNLARPEGTEVKVAAAATGVITGLRKIILCWPFYSFLVPR